MGACYSGVSDLIKKRGQSDKLFFDNYKVRGWLRLGAFGVVSRCYPLKIEQARVVRMIDTMNYSESALEDLDRKEKIHKVLKHRNIVKLCEVFLEVTCRYQVFEKTGGKDLFESICASSEYSEANVRTYTQHILCAVKYCHSKNIILRDLRPESFIIPYYTCTVKLLDIGSAIKTRFGRRQRHGEVGETFYQAPEITREEPYGKPVDVWSCGVILYNMLSGIHPFTATDDEEIRTQIKQGNVDFPESEWSDVSGDAIDLIKRMLENDQNERITASKALKHAFFRNLTVKEYDTKVDTLRKLRVFCINRLQRRNELNSKAANLFPIPSVYVYSPLPELRRTAVLTFITPENIVESDHPSPENRFLEVPPGHVLESTNPVNSAYPFHASQMPSSSHHVCDIVVESDDVITPLAN